MRKLRNAALLVVCLGGFALLPGALSAQCDTGCGSDRSCDGDGGSSCEAWCNWNAELERTICGCVSTGCPPRPILSDARDVNTPYDGPGYLDPIIDNGYLITDCRSNVYGMTFAAGFVSDVQSRLDYIELAVPADVGVATRGVEPRHLASRAAVELR